MITHTTPSGVVYEVLVSREEARARMATIIRKLYPAWLELQAKRQNEEVHDGR